MADDRRSRGFPLLPTLLIALGVMLLLQTTGVVQWEAWSTIWRLWPVLIIVVGINIAFGSRMPWLAGTLIALVLIAAVGIGIAISNEVLSGAESVATLEEPLDGVERVDLIIDLGAGTLSVGSLPANSANLVEGELRSFDGSEARTSVKRSGDHAELEFSTGGFDFFGSTDRQWTVWLSPMPTISIDLDTGASALTLDLTRLKVSNLSVSGGAADIEILAPQDAGHVNIDIDVGAANVDVVIPELVGARIDADLGLSGLSVDETRFPKAGGVYVSSNFDSAVNKIYLEIDAGASSVDIR